MAIGERSFTKALKSEKQVNIKKQEGSKIIFYMLENARRRKKLVAPGEIPPATVFHLEWGDRLEWNGLCSNGDVQSCVLLSFGQNND